MSADEFVEGGLNFRSVAGYRASKGRVKTNTIYRSGAFEGVGEAGAATMRRLNVLTAFDLRSDAEKLRSPSPLLSMPGFIVVTEPHTIRHGDLYAVLADSGSTPQACADVMASIYASLPAAFAPIFSRYFRTLVETETPVVVHCAAGKDRTGVVVAMLLDLLGVGRDDIMADYLATNNARDALYRRLVARSHGVDYSVLSEDMVNPVITANAPYLEAMFATVERDFGGMVPYAEQALRLSAADIDTLRRRLVV